jgi:hypothetical protein
MTDLTFLHESPEPEPAAPLPAAVERLSAYAWQRGAAEAIVFHGAAQLTTACGPLTLDEGTWLLVRWDGPPLPDIADGELICVLPEEAPGAPEEEAA